MSAKQAINDILVNVSTNLPDPIYGIELVSSAKLLGVYIQENFNGDMHFKHIITVSSQRLHILKTLKRQGLSLELLHCVFHAIILSKMLYAISAWYGFQNKSHISQINSLFKRAFKYGYVKTVFNLEQLLQNYDDNLLTKQTMKTLPCIISFPVSSLLVITYEVMDIVRRLVLLNLNFIKTFIN